jgi:hypothetical protein
VAVIRGGVGHDAIDVVRRPGEAASEDQGDGLLYPVTADATIRLAPRVRWPASSPWWMLSALGVLPRIDTEVRRLGREAGQDRALAAWPVAAQCLLPPAPDGAIVCHGRDGGHTAVWRVHATSGAVQGPYSIPGLLLRADAGPDGRLAVATGDGELALVDLAAVRAVRVTGVSGLGATLGLAARGDRLFALTAVADSTELRVIELAP